MSELRDTVLNEELLDLGMDNINVGVKITEDDNEGTIVYVGQNLLNMLGYTREECMEMCGGTMQGGIYPPDIETVMQKYKVELEKNNEYKCEYRVRNKKGELVWLMDTGKKYIDKDGKTRINSLIMDITTIKNTIDELRYQANYDELTGIYNKNTFYEQTKNLLDKNENKEYAVIRWDIEHFKIINDLFGNDEGDKLLRYISHNLRMLIDDKGTFGRIDADVFVMCIEKKDNSVYKLLDAISSKLEKYPIDFEIVPCFGIYMVNRDEDIPVSIMCDRANLALRTIKGNYMKRFALYDDNLRLKLVKEHEITFEMNTALEEEQFEVYLQPKYSLSDENIVGAEALVRWNHPTKGMISPGVFIPIFEHNGFIMKLDEYIWEHTCMIMKKWKEQGRDMLPISINISRIDLYNPHLCEFLIALVKKYEIPPRYLELEITESAYTENLNQLLPVMKRLQEHGFIILMDDFGTGYSSLNMLKEVPVDVLKIDMNFLRGDIEQGRGGVILNSVVRMAKWLSLPVIAEGVETNTQVDFLKSIGCDDAQGFYYSRPIPVSEFEKLVGYTNTEVKEFGKIVNGINLDKLWNPNSDSSILFDSIIGAIAVYEVNVENKVIEMVRSNEEYAHLVNEQNEDDFYEVNVSDYIHEDDKDAVFNAIKNLQFNESTNIEYRRYKKNGDIMWIRAMMRKLNYKNESNDIIYISIFDITDRKEKELQLTKENHILSKSLDNVPIGVAIYEIVDGGLKTSFISDNALKIMGYTREEYYKNAVGGVFAFVDRVDEKNIQWLIESRQEIKTPMELYVHFIRQDGSRVKLKLSVTTNCDHKGRRYAYVVLEDGINEKIYIEDFDVRQKLVMTNSDAIFMEYEVENRRMCFTARGKNGVLNDFLDSIDKSSIFHKRTQKKFVDWLNKLINGDAVDSIEIMSNFENNHYMWYCAYGDKITDGDGKVTRVIIYLKNIHAEKMMGDDYYEKSDIAKVIMDIAPNGVFRAKVGEQLNIIYADDKFYRSYGYSFNEFTQMYDNDLFKIIYKDDAQMFLDKINQAVKDGTEQIGLTLRFVNKSGKIVYQYINLNLACDDEIIISGFCVDKTDEYAAVEEKNIADEYVKCLSNGATFIYNIDLNDELITDRIVISESIMSKTRDVVKYSDIIDIIVGNIHPEYKAEFKAMTDTQNLFDEFKKGNTEFIYKSAAQNNQGDYINTLISIVLYRAVENGHIKCILSGRPIRNKKENLMFDPEYHDAINPDLVVVYRVNYDADTVEKYTGVDSIIDNEYDYDTFVEAILSRVAFDSQKERVYDLLKLENVENMYGIGVNTASIEYMRTNISGVPLWVRATLKLVQDEKTGDRVGYISIINIDTYIKDREKKKKTLDQYSYEICKFYDNIFEIDYVDNKIHRIDSDEEGLSKHLLYSGDNYEHMQKRMETHFANDREVEKYRQVARYSELNNAFMNEKNEFSEVIKVKNFDGREYWAMVWVRKIIWNNKKKCVLVLEKNIDEYYQMQDAAAIKRKDEVLCLEKRNEIKNKLLLKLAHDIRTPISSIIGMSVLSKENITDIDKISEYMRKINDMSKYIVILTENMRNMAKIEAGHFAIVKKPFEMKDMIDEIETIFDMYENKKDIKISVDIDDNVPKTVIGDEEHIKQILINLLTNSLQYTQKGKISLHVRSVGRSAITENIEFVVSDTGIGFDKEVVKKKVKLFENLDNDVIDGIGLTVVDNLVDLLDGAILLESEIDVGSKITVRLPLGVNSKKSDNTDHDKLSKYNFNSKRVLVVEDNEINAEFASSLLESANLRIDIASNGREAFEKVSESPIEYYDAILMDIRMPVMDGKEATKAIRQLPRNDVKAMPIIAMSADVYFQEINDAKKIGMDDYLTKPVDKFELYDILYKYLGND